MAYLRKSDGIPEKGKGARLSLKMKAFIEEYLICKNATEAVIKAGYKSKTPAQLAAELKNHPLVIEELKRRQEMIQDEREIERDYLLNKLVQIIDNADETTANKIRAIELAGKSIALWRERQEISGPDGEAIKTEQKTEQNVADFKSKLSRLTKRTGTGNVVEFPDSSGDGEA